MNNSQLPKYIEPNRAADQKSVLIGSASTVEMTRLNSMLLNIDITMAATLAFDRDEQGIVNIKGEVSGLLPLQCQRCLEMYSFPVKSSFALGVVADLEGADKLPPHYEPALTAVDGELALWDLIEDELILQIPIVPKHLPDDCQTKLQEVNEVETKYKPEKINPFHVLKNLKNDNNSSY